MPGSLHPPSPIPAGWDPPLRAPCPSPSPRCVGHARGSLRLSGSCDGVAPSPSPSPFPSLGCGVLGAEQIFWRPPDNSALYLPPVPPNTLVSAAALCCKFPWSNYVLIYDNPGRAVEGGKRQSSLEVACGGPGSPVAHADRELLHLGAKAADGESVPERGPGLSPGERGHLGVGYRSQLAEQERPQRGGRWCCPSHHPSGSSGPPVGAWAWVIPG